MTLNNYLVLASHDGDEYLWNVYEVATEQVVQSYYFEEDAIAAVEFYEDGGAFAGFTPMFMLTEARVPRSNVNEEFTRFLL